MTRRILALSIALSLALYSTAALAEASIQFSTIGLQAPKDPNVHGARFVLLYGVNQSVHGFDLGMMSFSESVTQSGFSANMGLSKVSGQSGGLALSLINIHGGHDTGMNAAFVNIVEAMDHGINVSFLNITKGFSNVDLGGLSMSEKSDIQLGFVNFTREIGSLQIGFLNFAGNGFFPVFPFFNFPKN